MDPIDSAGIACQGVSSLLAWSSGRTQVESYLGASRNSLIPQARFSSIAGPMVFWSATRDLVRRFSRWLILSVCLSVCHASFRGEFLVVGQAQLRVARLQRAT